MRRNAKIRRAIMDAGVAWEDIATRAGYGWEHFCKAMKTRELPPNMRRRIERAIRLECRDLDAIDKNASVNSRRPKPTERR